MKKTLSLFSVVVFAGFGFVAPALANENEEGLVSNGIEVSEIIEKTEIPVLYEDTDLFKVKTHPDHQEISVGAYLGEDSTVDNFVPEYENNSAIFDFSEVELKAGDTITFFIQDGIVFSEEFVRTVQPAETAAEETVDENSEEGGVLPNTATNTPMMMVMSISLVVLGGALLAVRRRKSSTM